MSFSGSYSRTWHFESWQCSLSWVAGMPSSTLGLALDRLWPLHQTLPLCLGAFALVRHLPGLNFHLLSLVRAKNPAEVLKDSLLHLTPFKLLSSSLCLIGCLCSETPLFLAISHPFPHPDTAYKSNLSGAYLGLSSFSPYHNHSSLHFLFYTIVCLLPQ